MKTLRTEAGDPPEVRLTPKRIESKTTDIVETFGSPEGLKAVARLEGLIDEAERRALVQQFAHAIEVLEKARAKLER